MRKALVVLSGGQDSVTCLFWAKSYFEEVHAISFDYGQRHKLELEAAHLTADLAEVASHEIVRLPEGILHSTSPLVSDNELEKYSSFSEMDLIIGDRVEKTFVPMRNTLFLTIAANRAVELGCDAIVTGVCGEDNANYPDCRADFIAALDIAIEKSLGKKIPITAPLITKSKAATVKLALMTPGAYHALAYSHTSYDGKFPPTDNNHSNVLRAEGFLQAGVPDPLVLRAVSLGLMQLPDTANYSSLAIQRILSQSGSLYEEFSAIMEYRAKQEVSPQ